MSLEEVQPIIKNLDALTIIGLGARFISAISPDANNFAIIPKLWQDYTRRSGEIQSRLSPIAYGLTICLGENDHKSHPDEMLYVAGASVSPDAPVPSGMTKIPVPAGQYAVFTHRGLLDTLPQTVKYIYTSWLPASNFKLRPAPHLEIHDARFKPHNPASEFDICVPIE